MKSTESKPCLTGNILKIGIAEVDLFALKCTACDKKIEGTKLEFYLTLKGEMKCANCESEMASAAKDGQF